MQFFFEFKLFYRYNVYKRIIITFGNTSTLSSSGISIVHQAYFRVSNSSDIDDGYWPPTPILKVHISVTKLVFPITN